MRHILLSGLGQFATLAFATASAPFGIPKIAFWMYFCAALLLIIGLFKIPKELPQEHGLDKVMPFGRLFFAIPMTVFGSEHFTDTADIAKIVPHWIPWHTFWAYAVGLGFLCAGLSIIVLVEARLAAALVGITMFIFVLVMDVPGTLRQSHNRFFWILTLRELSFGSGGLAFALSASSNGRLAKPLTGWRTFPRFVVGTASVVYGVEHFLHPDHVPGVPLEMITPAWIHGHTFLNYLTGVALIVGGACLVANRKARMAGTILGLTILLGILWVYLPIVVVAPTSVEALNYFFDTLLFCGTILLVAGAMKKEPAA